MAQHYTTQEDVDRMIAGIRIPKNIVQYGPSSNRGMKMSEIGEFTEEDFDIAFDETMEDE
jgi:hypothetical protein